MKNLDWDFENADTDIYTSYLHNYTAKFIPQIPERFIKEYTDKGDTIIDPFVGSGTSIMIAGTNHRKSYGYDLNPLACMISRSKTRNYDISNLEDKNKNLFKKIKQPLNEMRNNSTFKKGKIKNIDNTKVKIPDFPDRYQWFTPEVLNQIGHLNYRINQIEDNKIKNFYKVNLSSILKRVSKIKKDRSFIADNVIPTRDTNKLSPDNENYNIYEIFKNTIIDNTKRVDDYTKTNPIEPKVRNKDSRYIEENKEKFDLAITSPPYAHSVDYARYYRLTFYWFNLPLRDTRDKEIGARSKRGRKESTEDYFDNVKLVYKRIHQILKENSKFIIVVGSSQRKNKKINTGERTLNICKNIGFNHDYSITREISNHRMSQKSTTKEKIIVLEK